MNLWLVLSHLACFVGGAVMWNYIARREGAQMAGTEEPIPAHREDPDRHGPYMTRGAIVGLVIGVWLVTLGVQQFYYQRSQDRLYSCLASWAQDTTDTFQSRSDATSELDKARLRKDDAADQVISVVAGFRTDPPTATNADFDDALRNFVEAKANLLAVQKQVDVTRDRNPYPVLECE